MAKVFNTKFNNRFEQHNTSSNMIFQTKFCSKHGYKLAFEKCLSKIEQLQRNKVLFLVTIWDYSAITFYLLNYRTFWKKKLICVFFMAEFSCNLCLQISTLSEKCDFTKFFYFLSDNCRRRARVPTIELWIRYGGGISSIGNIGSSSADFLSNRKCIGIGRFI